MAASDSLLHHLAEGVVRKRPWPSLLPDSTLSANSANTAEHSFQYISARGRAWQEIRLFAALGFPALGGPMSPGKPPPIWANMYMNYCVVSFQCCQTASPSTTGPEKGNRKRGSKHKITQKSLPVFVPHATLVRAPLGQRATG